MKFLRLFLSFFCTITTAIVFVMELNIMTADDPIISKYIFVQILLAGFATSLVTSLGFSFDFKSKKSAVIASAIHYLVLCAVMVGLGVWFGWMQFNVDDIISMALSVAIVYVIVFVISYILMKKEADELNKALKERNKEE